MSPRPRFALLALVFLLPLLLGDSLAAQQPPWSAPPLEHSISIREAASGERVSLDAMLDALAEAEAVFLGETHDDETTQRLELAVYEGLLARREGGVILAMEMFERDVQPVLDAYLAGEIDEATFLEEARPWGNYVAAYRPLVERAREGSHRVLASNMPRALIRRVAMGGWEVVEALADAERDHAPDRLLPNTPLYWKRVDNTTRGHAIMMRRRAEGDARLSSTQSLWDNAMGETCARALERHPDKLVLHVNGAFHSAHREGSVHQLLLRRPDTRVLTVAMVPAMVPASAPLDFRPTADFVVFTEARAQHEFDEHHGVSLERSLRYRLHLPEGALPGDEWPLLIWLGGDGLRASAGLELWREALGDEAMIASFDPPYRALAADLGEGGRWFWTDTFLSDVASNARALERAWAYLLRHHPVDPARVVVAGEGTGATLVAALPLALKRLDATAFAFEPSRFARLRDIPLPLEEDRRPDEAIEVSLRVLPAVGDEAWWREEVENYLGVGLAAGLIGPAEEAAQKAAPPLAAEALVRGALGLEELAPLEGTTRSLLVPADTPRARHWARLYARRHAAASGEPVKLVPPGERPGAAPLAPELTPESVAEHLPRAPGPFGGTTLVVLPGELPAEARAAWLALEEDDPLAAKSRFHRLRVATGEGERTLPALLGKLLEQGRKNVLVVPALFAADPGLMRELAGEAKRFEDRMTLHWQPGLGGNLRP